MNGMAATVRLGHKKDGRWKPPAVKVLDPGVTGLEREKDIPNLHSPAWLLKLAQGAAPAVCDPQFRNLLVGDGIVGFDVAGPYHAGHH